MPSLFVFLALILTYGIEAEDGYINLVILHTDMQTLQTLIYNGNELHDWELVVPTFMELVFSFLQCG